MARVFTREEFYDLVWSKLLTHLSKEFFISDVAIHKICKKHAIPHPLLGWWAKKTAGKPVKQVPLPKAPAGTTSNITIASAELGNQPSALASVREQARILATDGSGDHQTSPHPIVERTLAKLGKTKPSEIGIVTLDTAGCIKVEVAAASIDRLKVILPRIVHAAALQGLSLTASDKPAHFQAEADGLQFCITETVRREKHVLTEAERAKQEAWKHKRDRAVRGQSWDEVLFSMPRFPEWDYHPTDLLAFEAKSVYLGGSASPRRSFRDAKVQRLETMASDIAVGLAVLVAAKTQQRLQREDEQRRAAEVRRQRKLAARLAHIEARRATELGTILTELDALDRLRRLLMQLEREMSAGSTPRLSTFLVWAQAHLKERETSLSASGIEKRFMAGHLFGDDDDHGFKPDRWY